MMYHFIFGLRGGSLLVATPSAPGVCSPAEPASFFSSSCMIKVKLHPAGVASMAAEIAVQECDAPLDHAVDDEKVHSENEYRDHDDSSGRTHFFPRWRGDLAHLGAHVVVKRPDPLRPGLQPVSKVLAGGCD